MDIDNAIKEEICVTPIEFLTAIKGTNQMFYFRTYSDNKDFFDVYPGKHRCGIKRLPATVETLCDENMHGSAVCFIVQNGGQGDTDINELTAHFFDADFRKTEKTDEKGNRLKIIRSDSEVESLKKEFLNQMTSFALMPSILVETKNGFHGYWLLDPEKSHSIEIYKAVQISISKFLKTDPAVVNLSRPMRVPGFLHQKDPSAPFRVKCIWFHSELKYTQADILDAMGLTFENVIEFSLEKKKRQKPEVTKNMLPESAMSSGGLNRAIIQPKGFSPVQIRIDGFHALYEYLYRQSLTDFLGIDEESAKSFLCIFHEDEHPSANIFWDKTNKKYKYRCFVDGCVESADIVDLVRLIKDLDARGAVEYLIDYFNISFPYFKENPSWKSSQIEKYDRNIRFIRNGTETPLFHENKALYKMIKNGLPILNVILEEGKKNIRNKYFSYNNEALFYISNRYIAEKSGKHYTKVNKYINLLCALGLLEKVSVSNLPEKLCKRAEDEAKKFGGNTITFLCVPDFDNIANTAENRAEAMQKFGFTLATFNMDYVNDVFGAGVAYKVYGEAWCKSLNM